MRDPDYAADQHISENIATLEHHPMDARCRIMDLETPFVKSGAE